CSRKGLSIVKLFRAYLASLETLAALAGPGGLVNGKTIDKPVQLDRERHAGPGRRLLRRGFQPGPCAVPRDQGFLPVMEAIEEAWTADLHAAIELYMQLSFQVVDGNYFEEVSAHASITSARGSGDRQRQEADRLARRRCLGWAGVCRCCPLSHLSQGS